MALSQQHPHDCGVLQGVILSLILFNFKCTPLSSSSTGMGWALSVDEWMDSSPAEWLQQSWLKLNLMKMEVLYLSHGDLDQVFSTKSESWMPHLLWRPISPQLPGQLFIITAGFSLTPWDLVIVIHTIFTSRPDYCNLLYARQPWSWLRNCSKCRMWCYECWWCCLYRLTFILAAATVQTANRVPEPVQSYGF